MKHEKSNKLIVFLALAVLAAVLLLLAGTAWGIVSLSGFINYLEDGPTVIRVIIGILFIVLFAASVFAIICAAKLGKALDPAEMNLLRQSNGGTAYISSDAVSGLVQRLLKKNKQIKSANCSVTPVEDGITVDLKLVVYTGGDLTMLCSEIQNSVKSEVEGATGIPVRNVSVSIVQTIEGAPTQVDKRVN